MEENGCFPSDITYNIIVRGFLKINQTYEVLVLLEKMLESDFSAANSTIEMLVEDNYLRQPINNLHLGSNPCRTPLNILPFSAGSSTFVNSFSRGTSISPKSSSDLHNHLTSPSVLAHVQVILRKAGDERNHQMQTVVMFSGRRYATPLMFKKMAMLERQKLCQGINDGGCVAAEAVVATQSHAIRESSFSTREHNGLQAFLLDVTDSLSKPKESDERLASAYPEDEVQMTDGTTQAIDVIIDPEEGHGPGTHSEGHSDVSPPNACIYNAIMNGLFQEGSLDKVKELLVRMGHNDGFPTDVYYNVIMRVFKENPTYKAMGLFAQYKHSEAKKLLIKLVTEKQMKPDAVTYGTVINGLCKSGNTKIAIELLRSMETLNFEADTMIVFEADTMVYWYNMIIDSLCKDRMISDAMNLLVKMTEKGISLNVVTYTSFFLFLDKKHTYTSLIHGLCNFGQWKEVTRLLREMVHQNVPPNAHTFNIVVDALCKEGRVREAEDVLDVMIQRGEVLDIVTYSALMDGYCLQCQMEEARKVFDAMVNGGLEPDIISYNTLINGYCKKRRIDEALHLFKNVSRKRLNYNIVTYYTILHGLSEDGKFDVA
ncbi:LOW QUALITY PROTEIN: hypothetical protein LguiA_030523 [Lonicera macranthoides]